MNCFNKMKLVKTDLYLLLIDKEAEIFQMDYYIDDDYNTVFKATLSSDQYKGCKKVIAYYPLSKNAQELDLPLLPNPFECVDIKKLAYKYYKKYSAPDNRYSPYELIQRNSGYIVGFEDGYKAAQSKQFSLEDIEQVIKLTLEDAKKSVIWSEEYYKHLSNRIIQSLSTQKLPKEFIPEYDLMNEGYNKPEDYPYQECKVLKTIINPEGRKELIGTYKY